MNDKINVVLRTCDKKSVRNNRIVDKVDCIKRCFYSLTTSLINSGVEYSLHVIDDGSSESTRDYLKKTAPTASFDFVDRQDDPTDNVKKKSRYTVKLAYDYIRQLPESELVYIVEDDYLHFPDAITRIMLDWKYFSQYLATEKIGIFPQDFPELYPHNRNKFNDTYVKPCFVIPGPDRYYRTTWFTHESFVVKKSLITENQFYFDGLLEIGTREGAWEGDTISNVWQKPDVVMLMPMKTLAIHLGTENDISFYTEWRDLWEKNIDS